MQFKYLISQKGQPQFFSFTNKDVFMNMSKISQIGFEYSLYNLYTDDKKLLIKFRIFSDFRNVTLKQPVI